MNSVTGSTPPLHKRFDEKKAIVHIRNRYRQIREKISKQIESLQQNRAFREKCQGYYSRGYKDWVICSAIFNCMLNWKAQEDGLKLNPPSSSVDSQSFLELQNKLSGIVYPADRFLGKDMSVHLDVVHNVTVLKSYGFELRRKDFKPDVVEKFLRERMKHFDFDLPHDPLFGEPPGHWPKI